MGAANSNKPINKYKDKHKMLGLKVSYYRKLKGWTQEEFAEHLGMATAFIGAVEAPNTAKKISLDTLFYFAEVLEIPPHRLIQFDED